MIQALNLPIRSEQLRPGVQLGRRPSVRAVEEDGPPPRILILSAAVGSGHLRAAEAIECALKQVRPDAILEKADVLALSTAPFRHCYGQMYLELIRFAPAFLGQIYNAMDKPTPPDRSDYWYRLRVSLERMSMRPLLNLLRSQPWDLVINTFFLPGEIVASLRRDGHFAAPQVMVVTDFETHGNWVCEPCERYFTATDEAAAYLQCFGVPPGRAITTGIPIHPVFTEPKDRSACLARQGLKGDRPVLLLLAGGHGASPLEDPYHALLEIQRPVDVVVVCGHNEEAARRLARLPVPPRHRCKVLGYTHDMDELLVAADLVVTKPGGLTVSEALARGAGLVLINPIPGQEERNSDYLLENGAAIKINHLPTLAHKLAALLDDRDRLTRLRAAARRLARPRAAFDIAEESLAVLHQARQLSA